MSILGHNDEALGINDWLKYSIRDERIGPRARVDALDESVQIAARTDIDQWCLVYMVGSILDGIYVTDAQLVSIRLGQPEPNFPYKRRIGAVASLPDSTAIQRIMQTDRVVQFGKDYAVDDAYSEPPKAPTVGRTTNGVWLLRGARGHWCPGHSIAAFFRMEVDTQSGTGYRQGNIASGNQIHEGTDDDGNYSMRGQHKGDVLTSGNRQYTDMMRLPIIPGPNEGVFAPMANSSSRVVLHASGHELKPN